MTCLGMAFLRISCAWVSWSVWDLWVFIFEKFLAIISSKLFLPPPSSLLQGLLYTCMY